jgi:5-methylcytosine-specific restriction enzyme subunit McrC
LNAPDIKIGHEGATLASHGRIPIRNLWLLLLYAWDLANFIGRMEVEVEASPDLPSLIARLLAYATEKRLKRNLSRGFRPREAVLSRVRGRIDILQTLANDQLDRGQVACRFDDLTIDTPRNRFVRAALTHIAGCVDDHDLAHRCRTLSRDLARLGVGGLRPSREELAKDQIARVDADDRLMVVVAALAFDLVLPTEDTGPFGLTSLEREERFLWQVFEKAVAGFYRIEFKSLEGWSVEEQKRLDWQISDATAGIHDILPGMRTDIIVTHTPSSRRIVVDTKFTGALAPGRFAGDTLKSEYLYQMYAYLRSQTGTGDPLAERSQGLLLHPAIGKHLDEAVTIQGHRIRFATVDLAESSEEIRSRLREVITTPG